MHGNTVQLFRSSFHSPAREDFHYMQVIAACDLHAFPFSTAKVKKCLTCVQASNVFHYVVQATTLKSQEYIDIRARHIFHYAMQARTSNSQEFIDIRTKHLSKQTKINLYCKFCFYAFY